MNVKNIFRFIFWLCPLVAFAQRSGVGRWQDHYSYNNVFSVVVMGNEVSGVTENGLFFFNKKENSIRRKTTVQGLSGVGLTASNFDPSTQIQIIGYEDGNIDLILPNGRVVNIPDLQRWQTTGSKRINNIVVQNSQRVFLCCDFGIVVLNLLRREISEIYFIGPNNSFVQVNDLAVDLANSAIYAATETGLLRASLNSRLQSDTSWREKPVNSNIGQPIRSVDLWNNNLIVNQNGDTILRYFQNQWHGVDTARTSQIKVSNNRLLQLREIPDIDYFWEIREYSSDFQILQEYRGDNDFVLWELQDFAVDSENNLWFSTGYSGLSRLTPNWTNRIEIFPRGPASNNVYSLTHSLTTLYSANGSVSAADWAPRWRAFAVDYFRDGNWGLFNFHRLLPHWFTDATSVAEDPRNPNVFVVAAWNGGLVQHNADGTVTVFDTTNSTIRPLWNGWAYRTRIGDVHFGRRNQL